MPKEIHPYTVILRPLVTEKSTILAGQNQYVFRSRRPPTRSDQTKPSSSPSTSKVKAVNVMNVRGKCGAFAPGPPRRLTGRKPSSPFRPGHKIELIEGV